MFEPQVRPDQVSLNQIDPDLLVLFPERFQLAALAVLGLAGAGVGFAAPHFISPIAPVVTYLFWLGGGLSTAAGLWMAWRLLRPRPALIADSAGVADYTFWGDAVFVRWQDVAGIDVVKPQDRRDAQAQACLVIRPRPDAAVARETTGVARLLRRVKSGHASDGLRVSETMLPVPIEDVRDHLLQMWRRHAAAGGPHQP